MELALSLGDNTPKSFSVLEKKKSQKIMNKELVFCMEKKKMMIPDDGEPGFFHGPRRDSSSDPPVQLDLLPFSPVHKTQPSSNKFPYTWLNERFCGDSTGLEKTDQETPSLSSSSFHMDFPIYFGRENNNNTKREYEQINNNKNSENEGTPSRGSDEEENGLMCRKKLRLTKQQSAFLEESFKEHSTLNPKQKLALAKELNLRPRQVEVWFQNRRARTKLKQTEVDCEYLKKCCDSLTEENRKLQKELQELRALKASQPFYMQLPATTLTMCPSCERVATSGAVAAAVSPAITTGTATVVSNFTGSLSLSHDKIPNKQLLLDR